MSKRLNLLLILLIILITGCEINPREGIKYEKPFIIVNKSEYHTSEGILFCRYEYQDKEGRKTQFYDEYTKFNIGDTIK